MRRLVGMAVALVVVASACSSGGLETPGDTLERASSNAPEFAYIVGELPAGLELCAIGLPSAVSFTPPPASLRVYGDGRMDDPYSGPMIGVGRFELDLDAVDLGPVTETEVRGTTGFLGAGEAVIGASLTGDDAQSLTWSEAGVLLQVSVRGGDADDDPGEIADLVELADFVRVSGDEAALDPMALPVGFVDMGEIYALEAQEEFRFSMDHAVPDAEGDPSGLLILIGRTGSAASMNAVRFRTTASQAITVAGSEAAVFAETELDTDLVSRQVDWVTDDGLVLRLFSLTLTKDQLVAAAESVRRVDGDEWRDLQEAYSSDGCRPS